MNTSLKTMAHGWNTDHDSETPSDPEALRVSLESEESFEQHIDQHTEEDNLSSMVVSKTFPTSECLRAETHSLQNRGHDPPWQKEGKVAETTGGQLEDIRTNRLDCMKSMSSVLNADSNGTELNPGLLASLDGYSDVSSCSEADFECPSNDDNEEKSSPSSECEKMESFKEKNNHTDNILNALAAGDKYPDNKEHNGSDCESSCDHQNNVIDDGSLHEKSLLDPQDQSINVSSTEGEKVCTLKSDEPKDRTGSTQNTECSVEEHTKDRTGPTQSTECSAEEPMKQKTGSTRSTECSLEEPIKYQTGSTWNTDCIAEEPVKERTGSTWSTKCSAEEHGKDQAGSAQSTECSAEEHVKKQAGSTLSTECSAEEHGKDQAGSTQSTECSSEEPMKEETGPTQGIECSAEEHCKDQAGSTVSTECSAEEPMKDQTASTWSTECNAEEQVKDQAGSTQSTECSADKPMKERTGSACNTECNAEDHVKDQTVSKQSTCDSKLVYHNPDTENTAIISTLQTDQTESLCSSNNQEVERSSFKFLQSCFGFKNTDKNSPLLSSQVSTLEQHEKQFSVHENSMNETSQNCDTGPQSSECLKATSEPVPGNQIKEVTNAGLPEPPLLSVHCKAQTSSKSEQENDCTEGQMISSMEVETKFTSEISLVSSQKLMKKLQPVVLLQSSEIEENNGNAYHCCACRKNSHTLDELIEHHHCEHSQCNFQFCVTCKSYFISDSLAEQHVCGQLTPNQMQSRDSVSQQSEKEVANFICRYCLKPFIKRLFYLKHVSRHRAVTPHRCDVCGLYFPDEMKQRSHRKKVRCTPLVLEPLEQSKESSDMNLKRSIKPAAILEIDGCQIYDCFVKLFDVNERDQSPRKIKCPDCGKVFRLRAQLKAHIKSHSQEKPFKCDRCQKDFKYLWNLNKHKRDVCSQKKCHSSSVPENDSERFPCPLCSREFKHSYNTIRHLREQCLKVYIRKGKGKVGMRYKCPLCPDTFSMASNRSRHVKRTCFQRFKANWLVNRKKVETKAKKVENDDSNAEVEDEKEGKLFECKLCQATFLHKSSIWKHLKKKHKLLASKPLIKYVNLTDMKRSSSDYQGPESQESSHVAPSQFTCHFCERCFNSSERLKRHLRLHVGNRPFRCLDCGKTFKRRGHLVAHKDVHKRRIQCSVCRKILPSIGDLLKHRQSHIKKGILECPDCHLQFKFPVFFLRHVASHRNKSNPKSVKSPTEDQIKDEKTKKKREVFKCGICQKQFDNYKALSSHCLTHIPKGPVTKCQFCKCHFLNSNRATLVRHMRLHTGEKPFLCKDCGKRFGRKEYLQNHQEKCPGPEEKSIEQKKTFNCSYCPRSFSLASSLKLHERAHKVNSLVPCFNCGNCYRKKHIKEHVQNCKESESQPTVSVKKDKDSHSKERGLRMKIDLQEYCPHCPKRFMYRSYLLRHLRSHVQTRKYACMHCGEKYDNEKLYLKHEAFCKNAFEDDPKAMSVDSSNDGELKCSFCTRTFTDPRRFRHHILTHTDVKPYRCKECEKSFSRYDHLKRHQASCRCKKQQLEVRIEKINPELLGAHWQTKVQEPSDVFQCSVCSKQLSTQSSLTRHMAMLHSTNESFACKRCGKEYSSKATLKRHTLTVKCKRSSGENLKPPVPDAPTEPCRETSKLLQRVRGRLLNKFRFRCEYCPRHFNNQAHLSVHTRLHTGEKPFGCASCGERFIRKDYLQRHMIKCKRNDKLRKHQKKCIVKSKSHGSTRASITSEVKGFSCVSCSETFLLFSQLQQHLLTKHRSETTQQSQNLDNQQCNVKADPVEKGCVKILPSSSQVQGYEGTNGERAKPYECPYCKLKFISNSGLGMHVRTHTARYPFSCDICSKGFWSKNVLLKHKRKCKRLSNKDPNLDCAATSESELNDGVLVIKKSSKSTGTGVLQTKFSCKDNEKDEVVHKYQCSECDQSFTDGLRLISHLEDHGREDLERRLGKKHRCKQCGRAFDLAGMLERHMRTQHQEKHPSSCPQCFRVFSSASDLDLHRVYHDPNRPFACDTCKLRFWTTKALKVHECVSHLDTGPGKTKESSREGSSKVFTCELCNLSYATRKSYSRHCKIKHRGSSESHKAKSASKDQDLEKKESDISDGGNEDRSGDDSDSAPYFPCHVCGKTFVTSERLEDHQRCHLGEKPFECEECGKCFFTLLNLQQHQRSHKTEFQCNLCGKGFISFFALRKHKHTHGKKRPHRCTKCHLSFTGSSQLAEHMITHRDENFPCDLCDETFSCKSSRAEHRKTHTEQEEAIEELPPLIPPTKQISPPTPPPPLPQPMSKSLSLANSQQFKYLCEICQLRFKDPEQLSEHGCHPAHGRPYSCPECNKYFLHGSHLKKHQLCHQLSGTRSFQCKSCQKRFTHKQQYLIHMRKHGDEPSEPEIQKNETTLETNNVDQDKIYKCPICPERFAQALELADHLSVHSHMCSVCKKTFPTKEKLEEHEQCHVAAATQYECTECGNSFLGSDAFRQHNCARQKRSFSDAHHGHSSKSPPRKKRSTGASFKVMVEEVDEEEEVDVGEDFYNCPVCDKRFSSSNSLQEHQKLHEDARPFKCLVCGKGFAKKKYLIQHQNLHSECPYQCKFCTESFKTEPRLVSHLRTHDESRKHKCSVCSKSYRSASELSKHARKHPELQNLMDTGGDYRCDMCYKSFNSVSKLEKHQETHVGQVVYECTECDKAFAFLNLLEEHQQTHAPALDVSQSSAHIFFQSPVDE